MRSAVISFPGSNCERDALTVMQVQGMNPAMVWHADSSLPQGLDLIVLPGGFSYGDYLRCGAMAARSPIMQAVAEFAMRGGFVLGICNGFQILCEAGMLPGTLMHNEHLKFNCKNVHLKVENNQSAFTDGYAARAVITLPVAHHEGNYFADKETLGTLEKEGQIVFRYCRDDGMVADDANPNGAARGIAGIINKQGNVLGMMPHPERHADELVGGTDGAPMFASLVKRFA